jgi:hypothetical protein
MDMMPLSFGVALAVFLGGLLCLAILQSRR